MKFLFTKELGRLAKWMRILGFDARYETLGNKTVARLEALKEERVLVTRNQRFGTRHGGIVIFLKCDLLAEQLRSLLQQMQIKIDRGKLFSRCILCNELLAPVEKGVIEKEVPGYVYETQESFMRCPKCRKIYWKGTHWGNVEEIIEKITDENRR